MRLLRAVRWLLTSEALPREPQAQGRRGPLRRALGWLLASEVLPEAPPEARTEEIGLVHWLLARERLPIVEYPRPQLDPEEGADAAG